MKIKAINLILKNSKLNVAQKIQQVSQIEGVVICSMSYLEFCRATGCKKIDRKCIEFPDDYVLADIGVQNGILFYMQL